MQTKKVYTIYGTFYIYVTRIYDSESRRRSGDVFIYKNKYLYFKYITKISHSEYNNIDSLKKQIESSISMSDFITKKEKKKSTSKLRDSIYKWDGYTTIPIKRDERIKDIVN